MPEDFKINATVGNKSLNHGNKQKVTCVYGQEPPIDVRRDSKRIKRQQAEGGKGDFRRAGPGDMQKYRDGWDAIFGKNK